MPVEFWKVYMKLGWEHILDLNGYDHILFVTVLCALYLLSDWKKVLWLVTAFTLGHSITLALAALQIINVNPDLIEFLIPLTIVATGLYQIALLTKYAQASSGMFVRYSLASVFGLIHGLGFSNYFKAIIGKEESLVQALLAFNIGVELGQVVIVILVLCINTVLVSYFKIPSKNWSIALSTLCTLWAMYLIFVA